MKLIDLSHPIEPGMPIFPGMAQPTVRDDFTVARDGFAEKYLGMHTHTGTHIDAPAHMLAEGLTLDRLPLEQFFGRGAVLDVRGRSIIDTAFLKENASLIVKTDFLLFCTGWDQKWGHDDYFTGYPALDAAASAWLARHTLKGVGVDAISIDAADVEQYRVHHHLLSQSMIIIENCLGLERLIDQSFDFSCPPLPLTGADGSPVRAVALID